MTHPFPPDYHERVYAGVLGKLIGVYLGRPFEQWTYERIRDVLGTIRYYVHDRLGVPLIVTDDDISGTFTFLRALPDHGNRRDVTPAQMGDTWLNYIIEGKTILWWGGMGYSTEHTAFLRLKSGINAPASGSIALNGKTIAEQIGAQIFIDGWAMVAPGDPAFAADLAERAASVSHDGESRYAAMAWAAMEAAAFVEADLKKLIAVGLSVIPADSALRRMIAELLDLRAAEPDWRVARERFAAVYNYQTCPGACHVLPNHGLMILALLYGGDDFSETLSIVNSCGWDTDCNSGNVGCLMGIKNGLSAIDASAVDWRGPVGDRLYLPTADGGRAITDAVSEAVTIINIGNALAGRSAWTPKGGARFHFEFPGSVQGFAPDSPTDCTVSNVLGYSVEGKRSLKIDCTALARITTATFIPPSVTDMKTYALLASPTLYPGQHLTARLTAGDAPVQARLIVRSYGPDDVLTPHNGQLVAISPHQSALLTWRVPDTGGAPIAQVGLELDHTAVLDYLTWDGTPEVTFDRTSGTMWKRAWVDAVYRARETSTHPFHIVHHDGRGLLMTGTREWGNYRVATTVTPALCTSAGIAARVQGLKRYYALLLTRRTDPVSGAAITVAQIVMGSEVLAEQPLTWAYDRPYAMQLEVSGTTIRGWIDGRRVLEVSDNRLSGGGIALVVEGGCAAASAIRVTSAETV